jgi:hypothetical protein
MTRNKKYLRPPEIFLRCQRKLLTRYKVIKETLTPQHKIFTPHLYRLKKKYAAHWDCLIKVRCLSDAGFALGNSFKRRVNIVMKIESESLSKE